MHACNSVNQSLCLNSAFRVASIQNLQVYNRILITTTGSISSIGSATIRIYYGYSLANLYTVRNGLLRTVYSTQRSQNYPGRHTDPPTICIHMASIYDPIDLWCRPIGLLKPYHAHSRCSNIYHQHFLGLSTKVQFSISV